jgi:hypothetical protein
VIDDVNAFDSKIPEQRHRIGRLHRVGLVGRSRAAGVTTGVVPDEPIVRAGDEPRRE